MEGIRHLPPSESPKQTLEKHQEAISAVLEECSRNNEEIHVLEEALTSSPETLYKLYDTVDKKYKAFLGALVFAVASQVGIISYQEKLFQKTPQSHSDLIPEGERPKHIDTAKFIKDAKDVGRTAVFYFPEKTTSRTIVHLGQTHATSEDTNYELRDVIHKSQTEIAQILKKMTTATTGVFIEGYISKDKELTNFIKETSARIEAATRIEEINKIYTKAWHETETKTEVAILNDVVGDRLTALGFKETSPLYYTKGQQHLTLYQTGFFPEEDAYTVNNYNESSIAGRAEILSARGYFDAEPAETSEGNSKDTRLREILKEKGEKLGKLLTSFTGKNTSLSAELQSISEYSADSIKVMARSSECKESDECQKLTQELVADTHSIKKAIFDDREDIAIELIAKYAKSSTQNQFPLVYGSAHNFTRAVTNWNKNNPEYQFNLVTIKSK